MPSADDLFPLVPLEPCTLFAFWPEDSPPLQEEIRLALEASWPAVVWSDELEAEDGVLWGLVATLPDHEADVMIWAEERGDLPEGLLEEGLPDPAEHAAAMESRWLLGIESLLPAEDPQAGFHRLLRILDRAAVPGLPAVYDDNALVVRSGRLVADLSAASVSPRVATTFAIHAVHGRGGAWLHTHGVARMGLPDVDLVLTPADDVREAYDLIDAVVDALVGGARPEARTGRLTLGEGVELRALPLDQAFKLLPTDCAGGPGDRTGDLEDHAAGRLVLLDATEDGPPRALLEGGAGTGVLFKSPDETARQSQLSLERWGTFGQLFVMRRGRGWRFHVKLAFPRTSDPESREHLWFEVLGLRPGGVHGRLMNEPHDVAGLALGAESWEELERLTDWLIVTPGGNFDPEGASVLLGD